MSGLFGAGPQVLIDDATGRMEYRPGVLPEKVAADWFETLLAGIDWRQQRRVMYERELDVPRLTANWNAQRVDLTLTEFWMVHSLARFPGHVKDRDALMRDASIVVDDSTITSHVKRIRRKFAALDPKFDCIATVYGMGYRWNAAEQ